MLCASFNLVVVVCRKEEKEANPHALVHACNFLENMQLQEGEEEDKFISCVDTESKLLADSMYLHTLCSS